MEFLHSEKSAYLRKTRAIAYQKIVFGVWTPPYGLNATTKSCYNQIRKISKIRCYLTEDATKTLVHAHVTSRLDYCNSLFAALPKYIVKKLQRVQNSAARLIRTIPRRGSITRLRKNLHWLPVAERIKFKVLMLVYKSVNNLGPHYLKTMFQHYRPGINLRSSSGSLLVVKKHRTRYGLRALKNYGPTQWNSLPIEIRKAVTLEKFKSLLKTHLFGKAYSTQSMSGT